MRWFIFVVVLVISVQLLAQPSDATYAWDEPEINAYVAGSKIIPAGQSYGLQIILVNTGKLEKVKSEYPEEVILSNVSLVAYNLTAWLEGDGKIKVVSDRVLIPVLPARGVQTVTFTILTPQNATGKHTLTLHVEYERVRSVYVYDNNLTKYYYEREELEFPIEIEIAQKTEPIIGLFPTRSTFYTSEIAQLTINVVNEGNGVARVVEIALEGDVDILDPQKAYIPSIPPAGMQMTSFSIKADRAGSYIIRANISYEYFNGSQWVKGNTVEEFVVNFQSLSGGIVITAGNYEFERGEKGVLDVFVMNSFSYPVSSLILRLSQPEGIDLKIEQLPLGHLMPGEVRSVKVPVEIDDNAGFGLHSIQVSGFYRLLSPYPSESQFSDEISVHISPEPDFEAECNQTIYAGIDNQIVVVRLINKGDYAKDIHATVKPSPGILVKVPESYIQSLESGEAGVLKFKVDVDEDVITDAVYRMELKVTAKDADGDEKSEVVYFYVTVKESSQLRWEYYVAAFLVALVIVAVVVKVVRRVKRRG
jgi:hypothetical protein